MLVSKLLYFSLFVFLYLGIFNEFLPITGSTQASNVGSLHFPTSKFVNFRSFSLSSPASPSEVPGVLTFVLLSFSSVHPKSCFDLCYLLFSPDEKFILRLPSFASSLYSCDFINPSIASLHSLLSELARTFAASFCSKSKNKGIRFFFLSEESNLFETEITRETIFGDNDNPKPDRQFRGGVGPSIEHQFIPSFNEQSPLHRNERRCRMESENWSALKSGTDEDLGFSLHLGDNEPKRMRSDPLDEAR
ncbi:hypothetical protein L1887_25108 [Cichorium endivia]|nr:hypothetical protein L1887_25108 [Cichorium endivia]